MKWLIFYGFHVGKYTIHGSYGYFTNLEFPEIFGGWNPYFSPPFGVKTRVSVAENKFDQDFSFSDVQDVNFIDVHIVHQCLI